MNYDRLAECPQFTVVNEYVPELEVGSGAHESEAQLERPKLSNFARSKSLTLNFGQHP